jgi:hypothetical protein
VPKKKSPPKPEGKPEGKKPAQKPKNQKNNKMVTLSNEIDHYKILTSMD